MKVLVTGGAGFIGSSVVRVLMDAGHEVGVIDDLSTGKIESLHPAAWFRHLDIVDDSLKALVAEFAPDAVVHLAAQASVAASIADPERDRLVNAEGTRRVAAASAQAGASRVLSASSAAVYGDPAAVPLKETDRTMPLSPYGASKLDAEHLMYEELRGSTTDFASLRFANVYGPRQDAAGEGGVVAVFLDTIARGGTPTIFGDGQQTRDFIYVADVASAILAALLAEAPLAPGREGVASERSSEAAYNISTGAETSLRQLCEEMRATSGYVGEFAVAAAREGDICRSALDSSKTAEVFGWRAGVTLDRGLATTWRWFSNVARQAEGQAQ